MVTGVVAVQPTTIGLLLTKRIIVRLVLKWKSC
jgi:hypothetical protein